MIKLYQFSRLWALPNISPFCMKIETYLRLANLEYKTRSINNPYKAPKGKLPFIKDGEKTIPDSELIINYLSKQYEIDLDSHLSEDQKILSSLLNKLYSEHLYWIMIYFRWQYEPNWPKIKKDLFGHLPWYSHFILPYVVRKKIKKALYNQGIGRYTLSEVMTFAKESIDDIVYILDKHHFSVADKPSTIDASSLAFLSNLVYSPLDDPLTRYATQNMSLKAYCKRMFNEYYKDFEMPSIIEPSQSLSE